ncbi:MAG: trypsin-like peptidase domain-containing protein [Candidatus Binatia bacterium]
MRNFVVKIHTTRRVPNVLKPWAMLSPEKISGTGVVFDGKLILTNAHVIQYASEIYVQPNQSAEKLPAHVVAIAPSIDLALLQLENVSFFKHLAPLPFAETLPRVKDTVNVYGYSTGGTELSVTAGIVSRIEFARYYYRTSGLRIQVDAALNPGNSGGPAMADGKLVGLVFSNIPSAQNIGYLIPVEEIRLFLADVADGTYDGKPEILDYLQTVENSALHKKLHLPKGVAGLMVTEPYQDDKGYPLKEWDVIAQIGNHPIDSEGKVDIRYDLRVFALYLVQKLAKGGTVDLTVYRNGESRRIAMPVRLHRKLVVPFLMNRNPRYFIYGPLVFSQATQDYIRKLGRRWKLFLTKQSNPMMLRRFDKPAYDGEELVVVCSPMFSHRIAKGYDDPYTSVLAEVNGIRVKNLRHLVKILRDTTETQITFKFAMNVARGQETLVFNRGEILAATEEILNDNGIRYPYSKEFRALWKNSGSR